VSLGDTFDLRPTWSASAQVPPPGLEVEVPAASSAQPTSADMSLLLDVQAWISHVEASVLKHLRQEHAQLRLLLTKSACGDSLEKLAPLSEEIGSRCVSGFIPRSGNVVPLTTGEQSKIAAEHNVVYTAGGGASLVCSAGHEKTEQSGRVVREFSEPPESVGVEAMNAARSIEPIMPNDSEKIGNVPNGEHPGIPESMDHTPSMPSDNSAAWVDIDGGDPGFNREVSSEEHSIGEIHTKPGGRLSSMSKLSSMPSQMSRRGLARLAFSREFEMFSSVVILVNCANLGLRTHDAVAANFPPSVVLCLDIFEHVCTAFFLFEFLLRVWVFGCRSFLPTSSEGRSNLVDAVLAIVGGVGITWVIPFVAYLARFDSTSATFQTLTVLRAVRLARLVRVLRTLPVFREAWMLIRGLTDSSRTLLWTIVVIFFVTYTFGIFGLASIVPELKSNLDFQRQSGSREDIERLESLMAIFGGLDRIMFTLVQVLCADSFHGFMRDTLVYVPWSWIYFYAYVAVACLVLMNLVTAIIVENAMEISRNDHEQLIQEREAKQRKEVKQLRNLFKLMDLDGSGTLCWEEFKSSFDDADMSKRWMLLDFKQEDCRELFRLLDDGDGEIDTNEFFEGLQKMRGPALSKDVFKLHKAFRRIERALQDSGHRMIQSESARLSGSQATSNRMTQSENM